MLTEHRVKLALFAILLLAASSDLGADCVGFPLKHYKKHADLVLHQLESIDSFRFVGAAIGAKYLVFATRLDAHQRNVFELAERPDAWGIPTCGGGSHKLEANDTMLRQLGPGRKP